MTKLRPRLNHQARPRGGGQHRVTARACAGPRATAGSVQPATRRSAVTPTIPAGSHARAEVFTRGSGRSGAEADIAEAAALRALADVLGQLLLVQVSTARFFLLIPDTTRDAPSV